MRFLPLVVVLTLAGPASAQIVTVQAGDLHNPATWGGRVPDASDALIRVRHLVDMRQATTFGCHVVVEPGGYLRTDPSADFDVTFDMDQAEAAQFVGGMPGRETECGFVNYGRSEIVGRELFRTWGLATADAMPSDVQIRVEGDLRDAMNRRVVIGQTRPAHEWRIAMGYVPPRQIGDEVRDTEVRRVVAVEVLGEGDETVLTLDAPLSNPHPILYNGLNRPGVGILDRSIRFRTQLAGANWNDSRQRKGACFTFMPGSTGRIEYVSFEGMGAYGVQGCYAVHIHQLGEGSRGLNILGIACVSTGFRCTNIHSSNGVKVEDSVAYDTGGGATHFVQVDTPATISDVALVHNFVAAPRSKPFSDRSSSIPGEYGRSAACFWPGATISESYLLNLCQGNGEPGGLTVGATWPEISTSSAGTLPHTYVGNTFTALTLSCLFSWQNRDLDRDLVGTLIFGCPSGFEHGAYSDSLREWRSTYWGNLRAQNLHSNVGQLQDSLVHGSDADPSKLLNPDRGLFAGGGSLPVAPFRPVRVRRTRFEALQPNYLGLPGVALSQQTTPCPDPLQEVKPQSGSCVAEVWILAGNRYGPNLRPLQFGLATNAQSFWLDHDTQRVLLRPDLAGSPLEPWVSALVGATSTLDLQADALATPLSALPASLIFSTITSYRGRPYGPVTLDLTHDDPPEEPVLAIQRTGTLLNIAATVSADTTRLQFLVDEKVVAERTGPPWTAQVDLANLPADWWPRRRNAVVYARAFDGVCIDGGLGEGGYPYPCHEQRAYSAHVVYGPEVLFASVPEPEPEPTELELLQARVAELEARVYDLSTQLTARTGELDAALATVADLQAEVVRLAAMLSNESAARAVAEAQYAALRDAVRVIAAQLSALAPE